jgi:hypothetical protein
MLGYYIDYKAEWFVELLAKIRDDRVNRVGKIVQKLNALGIDIKAEDITKLASKGSIGRPHVARALIEKGVVSTIQEAFNKYLDIHGPAYVPHFKLTPHEAIDTINKAGGIAVFAHPAVSRKDEMIGELAAHGLSGLEVYYSRHSYFQVRHYLSLAKKFKLLVSGGSDFHGMGTGRDVALGDVKLSDEYFKKIEERGPHGH